jgi:hypothetical protein
MYVTTKLGGYLFAIMSTLLFCFSTPTLAQEQKTAASPEECLSGIIHQQKMANDPAYKARVVESERRFAEYKKSPFNAKAAKSIPVIVHVIYDPAVPESNISDAQIQSAIDNMNDAYANGEPYASSSYPSVNTGIQFCLAQRDPNNNSHTGINRIDGTASVANYGAQGINNQGGTDENENAVKDLSRWDETKYYNCWIVAKINGSDGAGTQGYANLPFGSSTQPREGAVMLFNAFGYDPNKDLFVPNKGLKGYTNLNGTMIHETGHFLGLYHTFAGDGGGGDCPTDSDCGTNGDCCGDTPVHKRSPSDCNTGTINPCTSTSRDLHIHNWMDYASDACATQFTNDQTTRMNAATSSGSARYSLTQSDGCNPVNALDAGINTIISPNGSICNLTMSPQVSLKNFGSTTITSVDIEYRIDGGTIQIYKWTGSLTNGLSTTVTLSSFTTTTGAHTITVYTKLPNGGTDQFPSNDSKTASFTTPGEGPATACISTTKNAGNLGTGIIRVRLNTIDNGHNDNLNDGTQDFACSNYTTVDPNTSYAFTVDLYGTNERCRVYIDYNDDGIFETNEIVYNQTAKQQVHTGTILIPQYPSVVDKLIRMRVISDQSAISGACTELFSGEAEDYGITITPPPCTPGSIASHPTDQAACTGSNATFSVTPSGAAPFTYKWQVDPGTGFVNLSNGGVYSGAASRILTLTSPGAGLNTYKYRCIVNDCAATPMNSNSATLYISAGPTASCSPTTANSISSTGIANVLFNTINHSHDVGANMGTQDFTCSKSTVVEVGTSYPFTITTKSTGGTNERCRIYIDYNDNGTFETGEIVYNMNTAINPHTGNITIPSTPAITGKLLRMRVISEFGTTINGGCGDLSYGEVEDYGVYIKTPPCDAPTFSAHPADKEICSNGNTTFSVTTSGTPTISYQWQLSTNGGSVWNDISTGGVYTNVTAATLNITNATVGMNSYKYRCTASNACGTPNSNVATLTVKTVVTPGSISGVTTVCAGSTGNNYSVSAITGVTGYNWTVPTGATITSGATTNSIVVTFGSTSGNISVTATNACGTGTASTSAITLTSVPAAPGTVTGASPVCVNTTGNVYSITAVNTATGYTWSVPSGSVITAGQNTTSITVTFGSTAGNVSVTANNTCGSSTSTSKAIVLNETPAKPGAVSGPTTVCPNSTGKTYSIAAVSGAVSYNWTVPAGASIVTGQGSNGITVDFGTTSGDVSVSATNSCGTSALSSTNVTVSSTIAAPGSISGSATACTSSTNNTYSVGAVSGTTTYTWTVPAGSTVSSGQGTASVVVTFGSTSGNITVTASNSCGTSTPSTKTITLSSVPAAPTTITGSASECAGVTGKTYSISAVSGATLYTWGVPAGSSITAGQGTLSITVTFGSNSGNISVTADNTCGSSAVSTKAVTITDVPATPGSITGPASVCPNTTGHTFSITAVSGAASYSWTVPTGASITSGGTTNSIVVSFGTNSGDVSVTATNSCGTSTASIKNITVSSTPTPPGTISGPATVCNNATGITYSVTAVGGATGYNWTVPTGATISGVDNTNSITVDFGSNGGTISVTVISGCGTSAASNLAVSTVNPPVTPGTITGSEMECENSTGITYSIGAVAQADSYTWTVPSGASITSGQGTTSIVVSFGITGGNVSVATVNACGTSVPKTLTITISKIPATPGTITGSSTFCETSTSNNYTISAVSGATTYNWTVPSGSSVTSGQGTTSINMIGGANSGNISVTAQNTCGTSAPTTLAVVVSNTPATPGAISGSSTVCSVSTGNDYSIATVSGATSYTWTIPTGSTITAGDNTSAITVTFGSSSGDISVKANNSCGSSSTTIKSIAVNSTPATPGTISGPAEVCSGSTNHTFAISSIPTATSYNWTVPGGANITSGQGSTSIVVSFGSTAGNVSVVASNDCGTSASTSKPITITTIPASPGTITGSSTMCDGTTGNVYSISSVNTAASYNWTIPTGSTITSGQGTTSITVTFGSTSGNIGVQAMNACGASPSKTKAVTLGTVPSNPGAISGPTAVCANSNGNNYSVAQVNGSSVQFDWTVPAGASITYGQGMNQILVSFGSTSGDVSVVVSNSCGTSSASTSSITVNPVAGNPGSITGESIVCASSTNNTYNITAVANATSYVWTVPSGATITSGQGTTAIGVTFGSLSGNITVKGNNSCGSSTTSVKAISVSSATATASSNSPVCGGETLRFYATGIFGATYSWEGPNGYTSFNQNPSILSSTMDLSGAYDLTVSLNGCSSVSSVNAVVKEMPTKVASANSPLCSGETLNLTATIYPGVTYDWNGPNAFLSTEQNPTILDVQTNMSGFYYVSVDLDGCSYTSNYAVTVNPLPNVTLNDFGTACINWTAYGLTGGSPAGGTYTGTGVSNNKFNPQTSGIGTFGIEYKVTDANGCVNAKSKDITVDGCAEIVDLETSEFTLFPNPTNGGVTVQSNGNKMERIVLIDNTGRHVLTVENPMLEESIQLNLYDFNNGVYTLVIHSQDSIIRKQVVLKK